MGRGVSFGGALAAACVALAGCSGVGGDADSTASAQSVGDAGAGDGALPGRRVCPSSKTDDGAWATVDGIDTSDYQYVDWDALAAGSPNIKFAFARVSAGLKRIDTQFSFNWGEMKRVGLVRGSYQYFNPSRSAVDQAESYLQSLEDAGGLNDDDLPPVFDVESSGDMPDETVICRIKIWLARVERKTGRIPIIYAPWNTKYFSGDFERYPLWIANYVPDTANCARMADPWKNWRFWQYREDGAVPGIYANGGRASDAGGFPAMHDGGDGSPIATKSDLDLFDGTLDDLHAFIATTMGADDVADPPPLDDPPVVSPSAASPDAGPDAAPPAPPDCSDGCCVVGTGQ